LDINREVDFATLIKEKGDLGLMLFTNRQTLSAALRLIPDKIKTIDELGLPSVRIID
jgi:Tfp pilus assembly pilus retraction ATPase PilT